LIDHYGGSFLSPSISSRSSDVTNTSNGIFSIFGKTNNETIQFRRLDIFRGHVRDVVDALRAQDRRILEDKGLEKN